MRDVMLILHFLGMTMGLGTSFAHAFMDKPISRMGKEDATRFRMQIMVLSTMGYTGMVLLLVSGAYLIIPYLPTLGSNPLLIAKLSLVLLLIILLFIIANGARKARQGDPEYHLKRIEPFGKFTFFVGIAIVALAVSVFH